jgi:hypothetical protein
MSTAIEVKEISDLVMKSQDFSELSDRLDVYCPFEALSVARLEIRHSNFLADLIDPRRPHGFDDICTRAFLETLLSSAEEPTLLLKLHLAELGEIEVLREWRNIDLLLRLPGPSPAEDLIFVVELKVEASESRGQLEKYAASVRETWPEAQHFFFFLTARSDEASDPIWTNVEFLSLVQSLEAANNGHIGEPKARMMLGSYTQMLRRRYLEDQTIEELAQKIWAKHRNALEFLADRRPNPAHDLARQIADDETVRILNEALDGSGLSVVMDANNARYVRLAVVQWDRFQAMASATGWTPSNRILLCEIEISDTTVSARMVIGRGRQEDRQSFYSALKNGGAIKENARPLSPEFSRVVTKSIRSRVQMEKLLQKGFEKTDVHKIRTEISEFYSELLPLFELALSGLSECEKDSVSEA